MDVELASNQIRIDDYKFTIISKNDADFYKKYSCPSLPQKKASYEDRFKIYFTSENITVPNSPPTELFAYTSISEMLCWRICFLRRSDMGYNKFDNYIQATILHMDLQNFIWDIFDKLPFTCPTISTLNKFDWITHEEYQNMNGINTSQSPRTTNNNFQDKLSKEQSTDLKNPNGVLSCILQDRDSSINGRGINIGNDIKDLEKNYAIDENIGKSRIYFNIDKVYNQYKIKNKIYEIKLTRKTEAGIYKQIIAQVGDCKLEYNGRAWCGMYILNLIPAGVKINSYGLYTNFFYDRQSNYNLRWDKDNNIQVISKPIEYKSQVNSYSFENDDFDNNYYVFIAHYNNDKFIIRELREALNNPSCQLDNKRKRADEEEDDNYNNSSPRQIYKATKKLKLLNPSNPSNPFFKNKYLKYKAKYIELKNKMK
jgi:hypothetical protein